MLQSNEARLERWERKVEWPLTALAVLFLVVYAWQVFDDHGAMHFTLEIVLWLIWAVVRMPTWDYAEFVHWLGSPVNAVLMILSVISIFWHAALGSRVIVEDYVHNEAFKFIKLIGINFFFFAAAAACVFSILKIAFWA
mgnify:CR=1 FL=1